MKLKHHKEFLVLIVPSSDDEGNYENATTFDDALKVYNDGSVVNESVDIYSFDTEVELEAFCEGYKSAIGYLGDGLLYTDHQRK